MNSERVADTITFALEARDLLAAARVIDLEWLTVVASPYEDPDRAPAGGAGDYAHTPNRQAACPERIRCRIQSPNRTGVVALNIATDTREFVLPRCESATGVPQ